MKIEQVKIEGLIPYEQNPRAHGEEQINRIANSIAEFGFLQPIVVDDKNIILAGHGRFEAAKKLGLKEIPVVHAAALTEAQKKAFRILDNKLQNDSTWDYTTLEFEINVLEELEFDIESWGLTQFQTPDILPVGEDEQGALDEAEQTKCPKCGHEFKA